MMTSHRLFVSWSFLRLSVCLSCLLGCGSSQTFPVTELLQNDTLNGTVCNATNATATPPSSTVLTTTLPSLPDKGEEEKEHHYSMTIFFILLVLAIGILVVHLLLQTHFHYLPESVAIVLIGTLLGLFVKLLAYHDVANWRSEETFPPTMFFLILLPPIIFESGYNLHKGDFFQNIGTIVLFAVIGTAISAMLFGGCIYLLGKADVVYRLNLVESFAFGSLISAVDPVATLAIFQAIDVDQILYMLVFGESMLNDAVSIVLTTTILELSHPEMATGSGGVMFLHGLWRFCLMFFASAGIGVVFGIVSTMLLKFIDLRKTPSLEFGMMLIFSYTPYALAEGLHLSGIMAILFCGIVMSHYTHLNLSPVTQITTQLTFRTIAFIAETCVFAYLGMAIFSFQHIVKPAFVVWSIVLVLCGRAANIYPLSFLANYFREHKITPKMQFIMWFSGLRGAVSFALSLHLNLESHETRQIIVTTTLIIVIFTILFLGGSTMPLMKLLNANQRKKTRPHREVTLSKTKEMGETVDSEYLSEMTEEEYEVNFVKPHLKGFVKIDAKYLIPFFTRRFTQQEVKDGHAQMKTLTHLWYRELRAESTEDDDNTDRELEVR